jgi:hypothetical protein
MLERHLELAIEYLHATESTAPDELHQKALGEIRAELRGSIRAFNQGLLRRGIFMSMHLGPTIRLNDRKKNIREKEAQKEKEKAEAKAKAMAMEKLKKAAHNELEGLKEVLAEDNSKLGEKEFEDVVAKLKEVSSIAGKKRKAVELS